MFEEYLVIDLETNALPPKPISIIEFAWALFERGECTKSDSIIMRLLPGHTISPGAALVNGFTKESLTKADALPPEDIFPNIAAMLTRYISRNVPIVGHNHYSFDIPILKDYCQKFFNKTDIFDGAKFYDTCLLMKADLKKIRRTEEEPINTFYRRLAGMHVRSKLCYCLDMYKISYDSSKLHMGEYDCIACGKLFDAMLARNIPKEVNVVG